MVPSSAGRGPFASGGLATAEDAVFPIDSGDTSPWVLGAVIEIAPLCASLYPAGAGSSVISKTAIHYMAAYLLQQHKNVTWQSF